MHKQTHTYPHETRVPAQQPTQGRPVVPLCKHNTKPQPKHLARLQDDVDTLAQHQARRSSAHDLLLLLLLLIHIYTYKEGTLKGGLFYFPMTVKTCWSHVHLAASISRTYVPVRVWTHPLVLLVFFSLTTMDIAVSH